MSAAGCATLHPPYRALRGLMAITRRIVLRGSVAALALPFIRTARAADLVPVKCIIPIPAFDESFAPFAVAKHMGYFKEEGFDVTFIMVRGSNEAAMQI